MPFTPEEEKTELRRWVREQLRQRTPQQMRQEDDAMFARFLTLPQVEEARTIFAFWGVPGREPETGRLVRQLTDMGKRVGLPRMLPEHQMEVRLFDPDIPLHSVSFGIQEPGEDCPLIAREEIDLVLVPAVCYDRRGYRLGFGGGYYDRWLAGFSGGTVGLCRGCILQPQVPVESHDSRVDTLITENQCLSFL